MQDSRTSVVWWRTMLSSFFFLTACLCWAQEAKPVIGITIDPGRRFQEIDGFGVNFNGPYFRDSAKPMVDMLIDDLGATIFRLDAYGFDLSNWEVVNDNEDPAVMNWDFYNDRYSMPNFEASWAAGRYINSKGGRVLLAAIGITPEWMLVDKAPPPRHRVCSSKPKPCKSDPQGQLDYREWIEGIARGRTVVSRNGHEEFLDLRVNGTAGPGDEVRIGAGGMVQVGIRWSAIRELGGTVELVRNGAVVASREGSASPGHPLLLTTRQDFERSGWLCARRMDARGHQTHTAAVFVTVGQAPVRASAGDAEFFVRYIDNLMRKTSPGGAWNQYFGQDLAEAQGRYRKAREIFQKIAAEARATS